MKKLDLKPDKDKEGLKVGITAAGKKYSVRDDRSRYFFPEEWKKFIQEIKPDKQIIYESLLQTGARIDELLHLKPTDIDFERFSLTLRVTKKRAKLKERIGKKRTFVISEEFAKKLKKHISKNKITDDDLIFPVGQKAVYLMMKRALVRAGIKDYYNFSLHNIRKTTGNWLKALGVSAEEICLRLGHDFNTYLKHYGSATLFDRVDRIEMIKILGRIYER